MSVIGFLSWFLSRRRAGSEGGEVERQTPAETDHAGPQQGQQGVHLTPALGRASLVKRHVEAVLVRCETQAEHPGARTEALLAGQLRGDAAAVVADVEVGQVDRVVPPG